MNGITAPKGYVLSGKVHTLTVKAGQTTGISATDKEQLGAITIYKEGEVLSSWNGSNFTYEKKKLSGAAFKVTAGADIYKADGTKVYSAGDVVAESLTTGTDGQVVLSDLHLGTYVVTEIKSIDGYTINTTPQTVAVALGIYAMAIVMYYTSQRNYMPGKEFGTARFENPKQVNKILADKDENFNRILSQNVKMSLDFRRLKLNGNILICGGSGAGKTFYEVKPNLMQMPHNCSFICTDPKGEILRSCGQMLKNNGYNLKVINLLEMDKSDCYNPFSYIREETDVVKLITNLISNTTPKGATPSDPFWESATCS